jgi:hypothetical protein
LSPRLGFVLALSASAVGVVGLASACGSVPDIAFFDPLTDGGPDAVGADTGDGATSDGSASDGDARDGGLFVDGEAGCADGVVPSGFDGCCSPTTPCKGATCASGASGSACTKCGACGAGDICCARQVNAMCKAPNQCP